MATVLFSECLIQFNQIFSRLGRRVCLLVHSFSAHGTELSILKMDAIEVSLLPSNTTSILKPLDDGFNESLKCRYRR